MLTALAGAVYLVCSFHRFSFVKKLGEKHRLLSWMLAAAMLGIICGSWLLFNVWSAAVVMIHLFIFWLACDIIAAVIRRITDKKTERNYQGTAALAVTAVYLGIGWFTAHNVVVTEYTVRTDKTVGDGLRVALIADSHLGVTLDRDNFSEQVERINSLEPDAVIIAGDYVDDDSVKTDMLGACEALSDVTARYGVYFAFGNHDKGYSLNSRDFTEDDLRKALTDNGVTILEDETCAIGDSFYITGRQDKSVEDRAPAEELVKELDSSRYNIVIDHQPNDYDAEAAAGADLVLSGHTHGGPLIPAGYIGLLMGANDQVYGNEKRGSTDFIVTSGISGWALPFKTGAVSEIVVVDIVSDK